VLVTTGDHALLAPAMVREFLDRAIAHGGDVAVALAPYDLVREAYPQTRRTVLRFSDGRFCGCNLFAFLTARGREMVKIWRQVENDRKNPIRRRRARRVGRDGALRARKAEPRGRRSPAVTADGNCGKRDHAAVRRGLQSTSTASRI
jgi:hypothetical protein